MSDSLEIPDRDNRQLGSLLVSLHRADTPSRSVEATYRIWRHEERASAAWRAGIEEERRRGAAISSYCMSGSAIAPVEREEVLRIWRAGDRVREEQEGGPRDGAYGVRDGELWWSWDERDGATGNQDDPKVGSGIGEGLLFVLDPAPLLGFAVVGRGGVAERETITAEAVPRGRDPRHRPQSFELYELGGGADCYRLEVDAQRGVLLEVVALREGEPFQKITTVEIAFDRLIRRNDLRSTRPAAKRSSPPGDGP